MPRRRADRIVAVTDEPGEPTDDAGRAEGPTADGHREADDPKERAVDPADANVRRTGYVERRIRRPRDVRPSIETPRP